MQLSRVLEQTATLLDLPTAALQSLLEQSIREAVTATGHYRDVRLDLSDNRATVYASADGHTEQDITSQLASNRQLARSLSSVLQQNTKALAAQKIFQQAVALRGTVITMTITAITHYEVEGRLAHLPGVRVVLPPDQQLKNDVYRVTACLPVIVRAVWPTNQGAKLLGSRTSPQLAIGLLQSYVSNFSQFELVHYSRNPGVQTSLTVKGRGRVAARPLQTVQALLNGEPIEIIYS